MEGKDNVRAAYTAHISLIWALLSVEWESYLAALEPTWTDLIGVCLAMLIIAGVCYAVLGRFTLKYDVLYLSCRYADRKKSVTTGIVTAAAVYIIGILFFYVTWIGLPIIYSTAALSVGFYRAYKVVKENSLKQEV